MPRSAVSKPSSVAVESDAPRMTVGGDPADEMEAAESKPQPSPRRWEQDPPRAGGTTDRAPL